MNRNLKFLILFSLISLIFAGCSSPEDIADKDRTAESERERAAAERNVAFGLESITVSTQDSSIFAGHSTKVYVYGTYINGTTKNISVEATYTVEDDKIIAFIDSEDGTIITSKTAGIGKITASINEFTSDTELTVEAALLEQIYFFPTSFTARMGEKVLLSVSGVYSNSVLKDISKDCDVISSQPEIISIDNDQLYLSFLTTGEATITAECSTVSKNLELEVLAPSIASIQFTTPNIALPMGVSSSMAVTGTLTDGDLVDLSSLATYSSNSVEITNLESGDATKFEALQEGVATVKATYEGFEALGSVTVIAAVAESADIDGAITSVPKGKTLQLKGNVNFSDGTTIDMSSLGTWTSANTGTAIHLGNGLFDANALGSVDIEFDYQGKKSILNITVSAPLLESMQVYEISDLVTPITFLNIVKGNFVEIVVVGTYSDGSEIDATSSAAVTPGAAGLSTLQNNAGVFSLKITGNSPTSNPLAFSKSAIDYSIPLIVTPAELLSITVKSSDLSTELGLGLTNDFEVEGVYTDTTPASIPIDSTTVSWSVSFVGGDPYGFVDSTTNFGRVLAVKAGLFTVHAEIDGKTAQYNYETVPPIPLEIYINTPADGVLNREQTVGSDIFGRVKVDLSDGSTIDIHDLPNYTASISLVSAYAGYQATPFSLSSNTIDGDSLITLSADDFGVVSADILLTHDVSGQVYEPTADIYIGAKSVCAGAGKRFGDYDIFTGLGCYFMHDSGANLTENLSCTDICTDNGLNTHPAVYSISTANCPTVLALFSADMTSESHPVGTFSSTNVDSPVYGCSYKKEVVGPGVKGRFFSKQPGDDSAADTNFYRMCSCGP